MKKNELKGEKKMTKMTITEWVNSILHNDENATDEELRDFFVANGLTLEQAEQAIEQRGECLRDMFYEAKIRGVK
jgi:truncated hemoglobin YjbI